MVFHIGAVEVEEADMRKDFAFFYKDLSFYLREARKTKKIVGWNCGHIPLELIIASGMLPSKLINKKGIYDFLILPYRINEVCEDCQLFWVPMRIGNNVPVIWWNGEFGQLIDILEQASGQKITKESLHHAIEKMNRMRNILTRLFKFCENGIAEMSDVMQVCLAVQSVPVDPVMKEVLKLIDRLEQKASEKRNDNHLNGRYKLLLLAGALENYDLEVIKKYERSKCSFVRDISYTGRDFIFHSVNLEGDLMQNIRKRYSDATLCTAELPEKVCRTDLNRILENDGLDGIVLLAEGLFEPFDAYPDTVKSVVEKKGIPFTKFSPKYIQDSREVDYIIKDSLNNYRNYRERVQKEICLP